MDAETKREFKEMREALQRLTVTLQENLKWQAVHQERHVHIDKSLASHGNDLYGPDGIKQRMGAVETRCSEVQKAKADQAARPEDPKSISDWLYRFSVRFLPPVLVGFIAWLLYMYKAI